MHILQIDLVRHAHSRFQPLGLRDHGGLVGGVGQDRGKLVTAEPGDHVAGPQHTLHPGRHLLQQLVTDHVPERVVDQLEAVEIEVQQRQAARRRRCDRRCRDGPEGHSG